VLAINRLIQGILEAFDIISLQEVSELLVVCLTIFVLKTHEIFKSLLVFEELGHFEILVLVWELLFERVLEAKDVVVLVFVQVNLSGVILTKIRLEEFLL
jgi:hypothetical protein